MKKLLLGIAAAVLSAGASVASDLPSYKSPPPPPPLYTPTPVANWTGLYGGVNLGGSWLERYNNDYGLAYDGIGWNTPYYLPGLPSVGGGVIGGGQVGYNYQFGSMFVVGVETDIQGTSMGARGRDWPGAPSTRSVDWFGTVRGRAGVALLPQLLVYGTGGFAYGDLRLFNVDLTGSSMVQTATGWTAGGGLEYAFLPNWSVKSEYLYSDIGANFPGFQGSEQRVRFHTIRSGINYKFSWGAAAPVMSAY